MKKIYSLACALTIGSLSFAQSQLISVKPGLLKPAKQAVFNKSTLKANNVKSANAKTASGNAGWFNVGTGAEALYGATSSLNSNYLFPDSAGLGDFGGTYAGCWIHHLAEMVDFGSPVFGGSASTSWVANNTSAPLYIDSMSIVYGYTRNLASSIVDTLVVTVYDAPKSGSGVVATSGFVSSNYPGGADTVSFRRIGYNQVTNEIAAQTNTATAIPGKVVYKILLTDADTAVTAYREKAFKLPTAFSTMGNRLTVGSVMFKPGYTYNLGDTVDTKNAFFFTSLEENGDGGGTGTFMNYIDCNYGSALCDYSMSHIVPQDVRYNNAASWNGRFIPTLAYTIGYGFEHHLISFHVIDDNPTAIKEKANNGFALGQNMPNPYKGESTVEFQLVKDAKSAIFTVTDVMGRVVSTENVATTTGTHSVKLGSYAAGVYYYSLNVDGNTITKKMIVE
jgi:hypothetical protein